MNQSPGISNSYKSWSFCDSDDDFFSNACSFNGFLPRTSLSPIQRHENVHRKILFPTIIGGSKLISKDDKMIMLTFHQRHKTHKRNRLNPPEKARSPQLLQLESLAPRKGSRIPIGRMPLVMEGILHRVVASLPVYPTIYRVLYIPGGAGFLPSTVCWCLCMVPFAGCIKENILSNESWDSSPPASTTMEF